MSERIVFGKSAHEYFREMVSDIVSHRHLKIQEVTEFYLVNLLAEYLDAEKLFVQQADGTVQAEPLAIVLLRALSGDREQRYHGLKRVGDTSLFVSGFFGDSLSGRVVGQSYYIAMGERAYEALKDVPAGPARMDDLFGELSAKFESLVDLFAEISELSNLRSNRGLVRLYERYLTTRSQRVAELLQERGVALFGGPGAKKGTLSN